MHKHVLEPNGQPLFSFPLTRVSTHRNGRTHSHISHLDGRHCCQKMIQDQAPAHVLTNTHKHTATSLKFSGLCTSSVE